MTGHPNLDELLSEYANYQGFFGMPDDIKQKMLAIKDEINKALEFYDKSAQVYQFNHPQTKNFEQVLDYILKLQHDEMWATQAKLDAESKLQQAEQKLQKIEVLTPRIFAKLDLLEQIQTLPDFWDPEIICTKIGIENTKKIRNEFQSILKEGRA